jgi:hypothetical protein
MLPALQQSYLDVARQVEEVVAVCMLPVDLLRQRLDCVLVGDVFYHQSCTLVTSNAPHVDHEVIWVVVAPFVVVDHIVLLVHRRVVP